VSRPDPGSLSGPPVADRTIDARGVLCPVPIIRLARAAAGAPVGTVLALLTDDPAAVHDVPAWCRLRGHVLVATEVLAVGPKAVGPAGVAASEGHSGPEPHTPNPDPDQALRHVIRLARLGSSPTAGS
jgi:tRNA 2-thiouridine synthesizing protein A